MRRRACEGGGAGQQAQAPTSSGRESAFAPHSKPAEKLMPFVSGSCQASSRNRAPTTHPKKANCGAGPPAAAIMGYQKRERRAIIHPIALPSDMPTPRYALGMSSADRRSRPGLRPAPTANSTVTIRRTRDQRVTGLRLGSSASLVVEARSSESEIRLVVVTKQETSSRGRLPMRSVITEPLIRPKSWTRPMMIGSRRVESERMSEA
mmetsp:Transcript_13513/g.39713  ORF Transcript_13513/g.39713 Transcript_13513/m.39713 type:complete len:207 (-) Transcript_13513:92-712(-)